MTIIFSTIIYRLRRKTLVLLSFYNNLSPTAKNPYILLDELFNNTMTSQLND